MAINALTLTLLTAQFESLVNYALQFTLLSQLNTRKLIGFLSELYPASFTLEKIFHHFETNLFFYNKNSCSEIMVPNSPCSYTSI